VTSSRVARILLTSLLVTSTALGESPPSAAPAASGSAPSASAPNGSAPSAPSDAAPPLLAIVSDASCPAPAAVGTLLREILGLSSTEHVDEVAHLVHEDGLLRVSLRAADSRVLGERRLPGDGSCEELARAAAVVLASWLTDAHPELVPALPMPPLAERAPSVARAEPAVSAAPPAPSGAVSSRGELVPRGGFRTRAALVLGLGFAPTPLALVGGAGVALVPPGSGLGAALHAGFSTWRSVDVDGGRAVYRRWPLGAGAVLRFAGASLSGEVEGGAAIGWLTLEGRSFGVSHDASDATFGPFLTARAIGSGRLVAPLVELSGLYWARATRVYGDPARPSRALPSLELSLSLGLAVMP
jgi:hypothetical protein